MHAGGAEAKNGDGAAAAATGTSGASTSKAAAAEERRQSAMTLLIPQAIDAEVQSGPLPQANTLVTKLQGVRTVLCVASAMPCRFLVASGMFMTLLLPRVRPCVVTQGDLACL